IKQKDDTLRRVSVSAGISLFSWGENVSIVVNSDGENSCVVGIDSALKLGVNVTGHTGIRKISTKSFMHLAAN
ncbi:hypothetical protein QE239_26090, partial [Klebsiella pneumoniae]